MRNLLSIALCLPLAACTIGEENSGGGGGDDDQGPIDPGNPNDGSITGLISQDTTWSGTVLIGSNGTATQIEPTATVTVSPGTILKFKPGASLDIKGTLRVQGTSAQKVQIEPTADNNFGLTLTGAPATGKLELTYAVMTRGQIQTSAGATVTITDSKMYKVNQGDLLVMNGGSVTMTYSQIGPSTGETDSTHCNIHTQGSANTINITKSNLNGVPYGLMLYGGTGANFTYNNWYDNAEADIATQATVSADVTGSWFDGPAPTPVNGATLLGLNNLATGRLADAGVRP